MTHKFIAPADLLLALAATLLVGTAAVAADEPAKAPATKQTVIVVARANIAPKKERLEADDSPTVDTALSHALEKLAQDNLSELETRLNGHILKAEVAGK